MREFVCVGLNDSRLAVIYGVRTFDHTLNPIKKQSAEELKSLTVTLFRVIFRLEDFHSDR
jgi:hypothetical protein